VSRQDDLVIIDIEANAFLHHMVRNVAGVLMAIGAGEQDVDWSREVLDSRDRTQGGITAPPHGLYLIAVDYPDEFVLPRPAKSRLVW
jgi:tRNA pseudouridine38-40 synthase